MLTDCREIWHDDATEDYGGCAVVKIHLPSKLKLPTAPHSVRISNSSFEITSHSRFETEQDISTLKQNLNAAMIALYPFQA